MISCFTHTLQTTATMKWFMLAMIAYPNVQKKCQEELDQVIGRTRMPTLNDKETLPYIRATLRELFRWRAVAPYGEYYEHRRTLSQQFVAQVYPTVPMR